MAVRPIRTCHTLVGDPAWMRERAALTSAALPSLASSAAGGIAVGGHGHRSLAFVRCYAWRAGGRYGTSRPWTTLSNNQMQLTSGDALTWRWRAPGLGSERAHLQFSRRSQLIWSVRRTQRATTSRGCDQRGTIRCRIARVALNELDDPCRACGQPRRSCESHHLSLLRDLSLRSARRPGGGAAPSRTKD